MSIKVVFAAAAVATVASSGALAADLAKKAPAAVDYVKVCDTYGEGFFYIPGSDTCLKIGGYVRAYAFGGNGDFGRYQSRRYDDGISTKARLDLQFDARSQTEFGLLRAFAEVRFNAATPQGGDEEGHRNPFTVDTQLEQAYVQLGGLTVGRAQSFFDFYTGYAIEEVYGEIGNSDSKTNLFAYTFGFGNGVTATVSLEDSTTSDRRADYYGWYQGNKTPDLVANVNITQGWGSAQIMAALHEVNTYSDSGSPGYGGSHNDLGYAIGAGVQFNLPMLGAGDMLGLQAVYSKGAVAYASGPLQWDDIGSDYDYSPGYGLSEAWSVGVGYQHVFTKTVSGAIQAGFVDYSNDAWPNMNFKGWDLASSVTWAPVKDLSFDLGAEYRNLDYHNEGGSVDAWAIVGRVTRKF